MSLGTDDYWCVRIYLTQKITNSENDKKTESEGDRAVEVTDTKKQSKWDKAREREREKEKERERKRRSDKQSQMNLARTNEKSWFMLGDLNG